jgi:hypothetical protein
MKTLSALILFVFAFAWMNAQNVIPQTNQKVAPSDTIVPAKGEVKEQLKEIKEEKVKQLSDTTGNQPKKTALVDTTVQNKYGDLLNDDSLYNKKYPLWIPFTEVFAQNAFVFSMDRFLFKYDFSTTVGKESWNHNIRTGWEWDTDRFGINFIGHPYSGTLSFNAGRANDYNYYQSAAFAVGGSLMWEYFCENTLPSYNDIINTPINGAFIGEILYRLSSNILDDRTTGVQRISRELLAGLIDPMRGFNRILQGKAFKRTNKEVYQKEPLNVTLYAGLHLINEGKNAVIEKGNTSEMFNIQFDYGNPFENRSRKPFDFFKLRAEFDFGVGRKVLSNFTGYGILFGKNKMYDKHSVLFGVFQYSDYWDNKTFELGAIGFGGGIFSKLPVSKTSDLYTNINLALIPFSGNSTHFGPDTTEFRDYNFGNGLEGKFESTLNLGKYASASMIFYYYMIHTYVGLPGNNFIGILKPRITVRLYKQLSIGFEHFVYYNDRYLRDYPAIHSVQTEQKVFLLLYLEDKQRRGHYN